ncbi:MAG: methylenetetrahydrofolate reductase C-terminal domain-containing protein [Verrucomicrobia bacterium]|nr:methylenetetrahydrofolate reductase C-terminal domain-containing protein [Verrucomicrobiota bacterium]MBU4246890.1 methylenetetrahydrofolate reductase C-terminal domain-containing protein [Verrucomicrobiota bacterium]MBU4290831.1 methylenetetrahydrofolate reductase C-terminal domain-containing protein [Verrucomicrobiota bacterium]MBU4496567.1 methylenetetrahydrofolate reductase C-terminal domain-containing protein [Verrucomicrobiota bacterium]MCG2680550.1 methylenetetrahydrofolate reductase 
MIVAEQKQIDEIKGYLAGHRRVLVLGCGTCVTVCLAGGEREVATLASVLRLGGGLACVPAPGVRDSGEGKLETLENTIERQCDAEFFDPIRRQAESCDAILSLACGVGVQLAARLFPNKPVYPALNTKFMGTNEAGGKWQENCLACGDCKLGVFGGVCPVTRCSKSLSNGPCGGSEEGMCEVDPERIECGWQLIYDRLKALGKLETLLAAAPPRDWSKTHSGGPRRLSREDVVQG